MGSDPRLFRSGQQAGPAVLGQGGQSDVRLVGVAEPCRVFGMGAAVSGVVDPDLAVPYDRSRRQ